jgi:hypothetical protein
MGRFRDFVARKLPVTTVRIGPAPVQLLTAPKFTASVAEFKGWQVGFQSIRRS